MGMKKKFDTLMGMWINFFSGNGYGIVKLVPARPKLFLLETHLSNGVYTLIGL